MIQPAPSTPEITYESLFLDAQVPMLLICADSGAIISANQAAERFYGYSQQQLLTLRIQDINQLSAEQVQAEMARAKALQHNHFMFRHQLANGEIRDVEVYSSPVQFNQQPLLFSVIHDVTQRVQAERQLNLYAQLFTSSNDMLAVIDCDQVYLAANQHYLGMLDKPEAEVIGRTVKQVLGEQQTAEYADKINRAMQGETVCYQRQFFTASNTRLDLEVRYFPFIGQDRQQAGIVGVMRDITLQKRAEAQLMRLAHHDLLTGLPNRLMLHDRLHEHLARVQRLGGTAYVVFIDLDHFKQVNDSLGHVVGDGLLVAVSERFKENIRASDTIARISGDEFVAVIEADSEPLSINQTLQRLLAAFNTPFTIRNHRLTVTISMGISQFPRHERDPEQLINMADAAMYASKQQGRNCFTFFSREMLRCC